MSKKCGKKFGHIDKVLYLCGFKSIDYMLSAPIKKLSRFFARRRKAVRDRQNENARLFLILKTGKLRLWFYEPATRHYYYLSENKDERREYNPVEFSQFYAHEDFEPMRRAIFDLCEEKYPTAKLPLRSSIQPDGSQRHYEVSLSVARRDKKGHATCILGMEHDITDEDIRRQEAGRLLMRYHTVFNSALTDMIYYDSNGVLTDINDKACQTFHVPSREMVRGGNFLLKNNPMYDGVAFEQMENTRTSCLIDFKDLTEEKYRLHEFGLQGKMYYESTVNPIRNASGRLESVYMCGRDITEMVESFHHQQQSARDLQKVTTDIQEYINNINYALHVSDVRFVNYYPRQFTLEMSDSVNSTQLRMSQLRCIRLASPRFRRAVSSLLNRMDHLTTNQLELTIETELHDKQGRPVWLMFNMVPLMDANGAVERYFGMCRNMTDMMDTEQRLAVETKKAQEMELLKQSFLTNMSYEIRTPLNTVVGFAELFEAEHDEADEPLFVEHIKNSSNNLLQLINDILFLSRLDANMIEYSYEETDFALIFESHCQMGWSNVRPGVKLVVENPYDHLVVDIDQAHLGDVIEKLCANAAFFTHEGTIRVKYEYRRGELTISVEDSGVGIDAKTLPHVFERFVRNEQEEMCGTGLNLPIVQALVQQMGGTIEFQSQLGKGTTAWVAVPCKMILMEKKSEIASESKY